MAESSVPEAAEMNSSNIMGQPNPEMGVLKGLTDDRFKFTEGDIRTPPDIADEAFPIEVFPSSIQDFIRESVNKLQFSADKLGALVLAAGAAAIGNRYHVLVRNMHTEPPIIWLVISDYPGSKKTPTTSHVLRPFREYDEQCHRDYVRQMEEYEAAAQNQKDNKLDQPFPKKPVLIKSMVDDITFEALVQIHAENPCGLLLNADEISSWADNLNRYNRGNAEAQWNKLWSGLPLDVVRKNGSFYVPKTCITIIGNTQPDALREFLTKQRMDSGFFERFDFLDNRDEPTPWSEEEFDPAMYEVWSKVIRAILAIDYADEPKLLHLNLEAKKALFEWQKHNTLQITKSIDSVDKSQLAKGESKVVRYALVLQVLKDTCAAAESKTIGLSAVKGAVKILSFFQPQNEKTGLHRKALMNGTERQDLWKIELCKRLPKNFTTAQAIALSDEIAKSERSIKSALNDTQFFSKIAHGKYVNKLWGANEQ